MFASATEATTGTPLVRGSSSRKTALMEAFQEGIMLAVIAAAGCTASRYTVDDGIDLQVTHKVNGVKVPLDVQLKATSAGWNASGTAISISLSRARYDEMRSTSPGMDSILVVLDMPSDQAQWSRVHPPYSLMRHALYWRSLRGMPEHPGNTKSVSVSVPRTSVFDDEILCQIMARLRAGGMP
ncbi:protein of unknown function [Microbacterium sp. RURRCA19A]|nr:protein of unknown function [Microbacterium sp. RURRCA19A]